MKRLIVSLSLVCFSYSTLACTAVNISAKDGSVIAGRTMEWAFDMKWSIASIPQGSKLNLTAPSNTGLPDIQLMTKYAAVGVFPAVIPNTTALLEGQNSVGLGMSGNFLPGFTQYQAVQSSDKHYVSILDFGGFALGMFSSVAELRKEIPKYKVWYDASLPSGPTPPWLHFVFTDRTGASIVIEFIKGNMVIHDNRSNVLTNAPTYDWHLLNLRNYLNLSNQDPRPVLVNGKNVTELGEGGGLLGLPADYTPASRFVRASYLRHFAAPAPTAADGMQLMGHILNNVDIPIGVAQGKEGTQVASDYTQFVAIKDLTNNQLLIANYANRTNYVKIDLNKVFTSAKPIRWAIDGLPYQTNDVTNQILK